MSILVSGSLLSEENKEIRLVTKKALVNGYGSEKFESISFHLIAGETDFMVPYYANIVKSNFDILSHRPFPILCVMGNHKKKYDMSEKREIDIGIGETVYQIQDKPFVAYLKRGKVYNMDGFKFLVLGGAPSFRLKSEQPCITWTEQEKADLFNLLETDTNFDFVLSQVGPYQINSLVYDLLAPDKERDEVAFFNDTVNEKINFHTWICSHYFRDGYFCKKKNEKAYLYLIESTRIIERNKEMVVFQREEKVVTN